MTNLHVRRPGQIWRAKVERTVTWTLWMLLLVGGTAVGGFSLVIGTIDVVLTIIAAATGRNVDGWAKLAWYFAGGGLLLILPWSILAVIVVGVRQRRPVWFWPAAALAVAVVVTTGLGRVYGSF